MRKGELLRLQWSHVDFEGVTARLQRAAAGPPDRIPLSRPALAVLEALPRRAGSPFVFPGPGARGDHLGERTVERAWRRIVTASGVGDVRIQDLRRTVGRWLAEGGAGPELMGATLGYRSARAARRYASPGDDARRAALESHGLAVLATAGTEPRGAG
jgi:integrase